jgi:hypothetical protein
MHQVKLKYLHSGLKLETLQHNLDQHNTALTLSFKISVNLQLYSLTNLRKEYSSTKMLSTNGCCLKIVFIRTPSPFYCKDP